MVRTTIACARCRASKVKCIHDGAPPCRGCVKAGRTEPGLCLLTRPEVRKSIHEENHTRSLSDTPRSNQSSLQNVLKTAKLFMDKFPELGFLHKPTFSRDLRDQTTALRLKAEGLANAMMALCSPLTDSHDGAMRQGPSISDPPSLPQPPDLYVVQTLLLSSMYEWGQGNVPTAWMYTGTAIRMIQLLNAMALKSPADPLQQEIYNRTLWSCFIMDRLIFSGAPQSLCLPLDTLNTYWPIAETDYAFADTDIVHHHVLSPCPMTMDYSYATLVHGFESWSQIHHWIVSGGRRKKEMLLATNSPWEETSPWMMMRRRIQHWRDAQDPRLCYPANLAGSCASIGKGEAFGYINLIYYLSIVFLNREYIPFLPWPTSTPHGPVDPPLLSVRAPEGWWETRAEELFNAAACITNILADLDDEGAALNTPFPAFCNFSAATMNIYVSCFPTMNLDRSRDLSITVEKNIAYLDHFRQIWPIGQGWWETVQRTKALYTQHSQTPERYLGKTRDDFITLEASIHDVTGASPSTKEGQHHQQQTQRPSETHFENFDTDPGLTLSGDFANEWPLWHELHTLDFDFTNSNAF